MDVGALGRSVTAVLRVDAASCGSHFASGHANSTPASCGLGLGRPDTGQLVLGRPCGPPESRVTGGILPPPARARWATREPDILARLPFNTSKDAGGAVAPPRDQMSPQDAGGSRAIPRPEGPR